MPIHRRVAAVILAIAVVSLARPVTVAAADPVVVGAGDVADCSVPSDRATANLLDDIPGTVVMLGDSVYESGTAAEFRDCYGPTWGRHRDRTRPTPGNHDYLTAGAAGYFEYFGSRAGAAGRGYYSYDLGAWHVVVLDSNCSAAGGCGADSAQVAWLRADLAAHPAANVLAYWHHPRFSSGDHGPQTNVGAFWDVLYQAGADIILNGHDHDYERFAPQDPSGLADPGHGIRQFVVGTGGTTLRGKATTQPNSQVFSSTHGVLELTLRAASYAWRFVPIAGATFRDAGSGATHGSPGWANRSVAVGSDTFVDQAHPRATYGTARTLWVDGDTGDGLDRHAYLRVVVSGVKGTVERAVLRLRVTNGTRDGPRLYRTSTSWSGRTMSWRTRPGPLGAAVADIGRVRTGTWLDLDVTAQIRGNGTYAFLLRPTSGDGLGLASMQGSVPPRLLLRTVSASTP